MNGIELAIFCLLIYTIIGLERVNNKLRKLTMTQDEAVQKLNDIGAKLGQIGRESQMMLDKVAALQAAAGTNPGEIGPELSAAISAIAQQAQSIDDLVPNDQ